MRSQIIRNLMQLTTIRKAKLVNIASGAENILDGFVQIFGSQGVTLSLPTLIVLVKLFLLRANF